jgi:hypothetical protein
VDWIGLDLRVAVQVRPNVHYCERLSKADCHLHDFYAISYQSNREALLFSHDRIHFCLSSLPITLASMFNCVLLVTQDSSATVGGTLGLTVHNPWMLGGGSN